MSAGDNTRDDRWRPGFASSERRVREELEDASERVIYSRELSFVPARRRPKFEALALVRASVALHKKARARHATTAATRQGAGNRRRGGGRMAWPSASVVIAECIASKAPRARRRT